MDMTAEEYKAQYGITIEYLVATDLLVRLAHRRARRKILLMTPPTTADLQREIDILEKDEAT